MYRIIEVVPSWFPQTFVIRHITALMESGINLEIVALKKIPLDSSDSSVEFTNIPVTSAPWLYGGKYLKYLLQIIKLFTGDRLAFVRTCQNRVLLKFFREKNPDLIHFHFANLAVQLSWIALELDIPYTLSLRGTDVQVVTLDSKKYIKDLGKVIRLSSGIHSVSNNIWDQASKICGVEKESLFHKTIYTAIPSEIMENVHSDIKDSYTFVTVGRLHWTKNYVNLLRSFKKLLENEINAKLIIIGDGDGDQRKSLLFWTKHLEISDFVTFTGKLSYPEIIKILRYSDAYIQSSIAEGFSNAVAEAMSIGLPIFATDVGGTKEIIKNSDNGFLLDPDRSDNWWKKLILIRNREKMKDVGIQAWKDAQKIFSLKRHKNEFAIFFKNAIDNKMHRNIP